MDTTTPTTPPPAYTVRPEHADLLKRYGCGTTQFTGNDGLYDRHLLFDYIKEPAATGPREHFEAFARSVRDVLSQRWAAT
jgi:glycogen phosphorylase